MVVSRQICTKRLLLQLRVSDGRCQESDLESKLLFLRAHQKDKPKPFALWRPWFMKDCPFNHRNLITTAFAPGKLSCFTKTRLSMTTSRQKTASPSHFNRIFPAGFSRGKPFLKLEKIRFLSSKFDFEEWIACSRSWGVSRFVQGYRH